MITELKTLIESVAIKTIRNKTYPLYTAEYEESKMMNLKADEKSLDARFAYIEEFVKGKYGKLDNFNIGKSTKVQIYFCRFLEVIDSTAEQREEIRSEIESEIILPFIKACKRTNMFQQVTEFNFYQPIPRFDANEVSIMLEFDLKQSIC